MYSNSDQKINLNSNYPARTTKNTLRWYQISLLIILIDQITKHIVGCNLMPYQPHPIAPFFNFMLAYNTGAAFSFLSHQPILALWLFSGVAIIMSVVIAVWLYRLPPNRSWTSCALALVLGGALGNVLDRFLYHYVVDFLQFYYQNWYFPTFNIADCAISVGATMLLLEVLFVRKNR